MDEADCFYAYWRHLQIRQTEIMTYLSQYVNLDQGLVICSPLYDCCELKPDWIYAYTNATKDNECGQKTTTKLIHQVKQRQQQSGLKILRLESTQLPFHADSVANIVLGFGISLRLITAMLNECYTVLKAEGLLIVFYPNKNNFVWQLSTKIRRLHHHTSTPHPSKMLALSRQCQFEIVENFTYALLPPMMLKYMPSLLGKLDAWCYRVPLPIGQCNALVLQKKSWQMTKLKGRQKQQRYLAPLTRPAIHSTFSNPQRQNKCQNK